MTILENLKITYNQTMHISLKAKKTTSMTSWSKIQRHKTAKPCTKAGSIKTS